MVKAEVTEEQVNEFTKYLVDKLLDDNCQEYEIIRMRNAKRDDAYVSPSHR
jgi:hypothetical protein